MASLLNTIPKKSGFSDKDKKSLFSEDFPGEPMADAPEDEETPWINQSGAGAPGAQPAATAGKSGVLDLSGFNPGKATKSIDLDKATKTGSAEAADFEKKYSINPDELNETMKGMDQQLRSELARAQAAYASEKDSTAAREMWDGIIKGVGLLAAGAIGQNTGLNLQGVKFSDKDWGAERDRLLSELKARNDVAYKTADSTRQQAMDRMAIKGQAANFRNQTIANALDAQRAAAQQENSALDRKAQYDIAKMNNLGRDSVADTAAASRQAVAGAKGNPAVMKEYNAAAADARDAYNKFLEKDNDGTRSALGTAALVANKKAQELGMPEPFPADLTKDEPGKLFGTNKASPETVASRMNASLTRTQPAPTEKTEAPAVSSVPAGYERVQDQKSGKFFLRNLSTGKLRPAQ